MKKFFLFDGRIFFALILAFQFFAFCACNFDGGSWKNSTDSEQNQNGFIETSELFVLENSEYVFETNDKKFKSSNGYTLWAVKDSGLDEFSGIDVSVNKFYGSENCGYGVVFGFEGEKADSLLCVMIRLCGEYAVGKFENGKFSALLGWTQSKNLKTGKGIYNKISIKEDCGEYFLYFNDEENFDACFFDSRKKPISNSSYGYVVVIAPGENFPKSRVKVKFSR